MFKKVVVLIMVIVLMATVAVSADKVNWNAKDKVIIEMRDTDGIIFTEDANNNGGVEFEVKIDRVLSAYWNDPGVEEILSIDGIPLKDTIFSRYAGIIDPSRKGEGLDENKDLVDRVKEKLENVRDLVNVGTGKNKENTSEPEYSVKLNGINVEFDVEPFAMNGRVFVPFRAIFEALGAEVDYDFSNPNNRTVWATRKVDGELVKVTMKYGSKIATKNGKCQRRNVFDPNRRLKIDPIAGQLMPDFIQPEYLPAA